MTHSRHTIAAISLATETHAYAEPPGTETVRFAPEFQKESPPVLPVLPTLIPLLDFSAPRVQIPRHNFIRNALLLRLAPKRTRHRCVTGPPVDRGARKPVAEIGGVSLTILS